MKNLVIKLLIIVFMFYCANNALAKKSDLKDIESSITKNNKLLLHLKKDLTQAEKELIKKQKKFEQTKSFREKISSKISNLEENLNKNQRYISRVDDIYKAELKNLILSKMNEDKKSSELLADKIYEQSLSKKILILSNLKEVNISLQGEYEEFKNRYSEYANIENHLRNLMIDLESRKSAIREKVYEYNSKKGELSKKLKNLRKQIKKSAQHGIGSFTSPISSYKKFTHGKKGITYIINKSQSIIAPRSGKVVHIGRLANYGNVVMIDHGNDIRSVLLGHFIPKVEKGQSVKEMAVIGYTQDTKTQIKKDLGKVYFEIRKKNKVYNTLKLVKNMN